MGISFQDRSLLQQAFVHRSFLNENPGLFPQSNERLEFLGDAVLGFLVAESLYFAYPELPEGQLTRLRAALVQAPALARAARSLGLGQYLYLGKGEEASGGRQRPSLLAATFEALVGALYIGQGMEAARQFVVRILKPEQVLREQEELAGDYKSRLQELAQARWQATPVYRTVATAGPEHEKLFTVEAVVEGRAVGEGVGRSKQEAEQQAARQALLNLDAGREEG